MLPFLREVSDGAEHEFKDIVERLAKKFSLTDEERREVMSSVNQSVFYNRVAWARTYLKKAGLLDTPRRAVLTITARGKDVLGKKPDRINTKFLKQFPEFVEFQAKKNDEETSIDLQEEVLIQTPEEALEKAHQEIKKKLAGDLMDKVLSSSPAFFETLVVELLVKMGYGGSTKDAGRAIGKSGDEGIDGTIKEDKLGLDIIYIQAKRWKPESSVGRPEIHKFVGALAGQGARKGIFITTSTFTKDALEYQPKNDTKIVLIDGEKLAEHMIDHNLGVSNVTSYEVKRIDSDYFGDE